MRQIGESRGAGRWLARSPTAAMVGATYDVDGAQAIARAASGPTGVSSGAYAFDLRTMLHLHRSIRADALVDALGALLAEPPEDPLAPEVVSVPTRGIERWIAQQVSGRLGVCANVFFPTPRRL